MKYETPSTAAKWLQDENLIPEDSTMSLNEDNSEDIYAIMWPNRPEERISLSEQEQIDKILIAHPGGTIADDNKVSVYPDLHHDYAKEIPQESAGFFNIEYSWAVLDDIFREAGKEDLEKQISQIRKIGETSDTLLRPGGIAIYDMVGAHRHNKAAEEQLGYDYDIQSAEELYAGLFEDELNGRPYSETEIRPRGVEPYPNSTIFVGYMPK